MIENILLKYGNHDESSTLTIGGDKITIFVGPNNSGKSLILREIENYFSTNKHETKLLNRIDLKMPTQEELELFLKENKLIGDPRYTPYRDHIFVLKRTADGTNHRIQINEIIVKQALDGQYDNNYQYLLENYFGLFLLRLDGSTRINLTMPKPAGDLNSPPENILTSLFVDDEARLKIREIIHDALGKYFVIDPTSMTTFKIKLANRAPIDASEEQALDARARAFHAEASDIEDLSDGVKAFTGIITSVISGDFKILLIDEPEAFLHPPLAKKLGLRLSQYAPDREATLIVATHSSDFIMGCIQSGKEVNIVRLTYQEGISTAKLLPSTELTTLMRDPLLRSTGLLDSLFHETVIITESDADRAFYQEINERLNHFGNNGLTNSLFLNAQNKQTIHRILEPLKNLGIKAAAIVDIDIVKEGGRAWTNLLVAANIPATLIQPLNILRGDVNRYFQNTEMNMKRDGGINLLEGAEKAACQHLFDQLAQYGIFVIPYGELESWLKDLNIAGHGPQWLMAMFERMGNDPLQEDYIRPVNEDVWSFIENIAEWSKT